MKPAVFVGPTLWDDAIQRSEDVAWLPPAREGDVYRITRERPAAIGLIDGRFETCPAVWHKEILWALAQGIPVYGSASMGALRAVELSRFGMIGVGAVYEKFRSGELQDDDEVALLHAPEDLGYRPLSEAMVDIRATLAAAKAAEIISPLTAESLINFAKSLFFKERTWTALLAHPSAPRTLRPELRRLARWLPDNMVEQKRRDALAMILTMREHLAAGSSPFHPSFAFQDPEN